MKQAASKQKSPRQTEQRSNPAASAGPYGVAIAPPAYGIEVVDRGPLLQRTAAVSGEQQTSLARQRPLSSGALQAKLTLNQLGDSYEQEADQMVDQVMRLPGLVTLPMQRQCACGGSAGPDGECEACKAKRLSIQRRATHQTESPAAPAIVPEVLGISGQPLDPATRSYFEPRFRADFSQVRVHTDARAAESARAVDALAYTVGRDIVFGAGQYAPGTSEGQRLLGHELTHVMQQQAAGQGSALASHATVAVSEPGDPAEVEAELLASDLDRPRPGSIRLAAHFVASPRPTLHRVVYVRERVTDDATSREARQQIAEARRLSETKLAPTARADVEARIREAEAALQRYRGTIDSNSLMMNPAVATATTGDITGAGTVVALLAVLAAWLFTTTASRTLSNSQAADLLAETLQRLSRSLQGTVADPLAPLRSAINALTAGAVLAITVEEVERQRGRIQDLLDQIENLIKNNPQLAMRCSAQVIAFRQTVQTALDYLLKPVNQIEKFWLIRLVESIMQAVNTLLACMGVAPSH